MHSNNNINNLSPAARSIVADYAKRRGIAPPQLDDFLNPKLALDRCNLPDAEKVLARLNRAAANREKLLLFGDYDCDGISSTAILLRFLGQRTSLTPAFAFALPDRRFDHYGLDLEKAKSLFCEFRPSLLNCLDCGTNSAEAVTWLKAHGVDTIVVDHHPPSEEKSTDAVAMGNPKVHPAAQTSDLGDLCAAGLTLVLCNYLARAWQCAEKWDSAAATGLAGLGTLADAVPMSAINRSIAKSAITLINDRAVLNPITGLAALVPANGRQITQRQLQFEIIPAINALGRLNSAEPGVNLLTTANRAEAAAIATQCLELNAARKVKQQEMTVQASALAREVLEHHPQATVLVLADRRWHHGVAGPTASQIAESFGRSTILLAPNGTGWKGSGRSRNGDDLGQWIRTMKALGLVERGGGHAAAVGLAATSAQIPALQSAGLAVPMPQVDNAEPDSEILGEIDRLSPEEWLDVIELLEPFGRGNPYPIIAASNALCRSKPATLTLRDSGKPWGAKSEFQTEAGQVILPVWRDFEAALSSWSPGKRCHLELEVSKKAHNGRVYFNWAVSACRTSSTDGSGCDSFEEAELR